MPELTVVERQAVAAYFRHRDGGAPAGEGDLGQLQRHVSVGEKRPQATPIIDLTEHTSGRIEVFIVNDDMPLLVEAVLTAVADCGLTVSAIDHPVLTVRRDDDGRLTGIADEPGAAAESWIYLSVLPTGDADQAALADRLAVAIGRVADINRDIWQIREKLTALAGEVAGRDEEYASLLEWFANDRLFDPIGYQHYPVGEPTAAPAGGMGLWCNDQVSDAPRATGSGDPDITKIWLPTGVQRSGFLVLLRVTVGEVEHHIIGEFTSAGLHQNILDVPILRHKAAAVLDEAGVEEDSYLGGLIIDLLQNYPLVEMFATPEAELSRRIAELLDAVAGRSLRLFTRVDPDGGAVIAMVYVPRDRYNTTIRLRLQQTLQREVGGTAVDFTARVSENPLATLQLLVRIDAEAAERLGDLATGSPGHIRLQNALIEAVRDWDDRLRDLVKAADDLSEEAAEDILQLMPFLPESYTEARSPQAALADLARLSALQPGGTEVTLDHSDPDRWEFTLYLAGASATLTDVLPVLHSFGLQVLDEDPHRIDGTDSGDYRVYVFGVLPAAGTVIDGVATEDLSERFTAAFRAIWRGDAEIDEFNRLIIHCGLTWRTTALLRTYARYLSQCNFAYSLGHMAGTLFTEAEVTGALVELFAARFDPERADTGRADRLNADLDRLIAAIISLDSDRVVSAFAAAIRATIRTNFYVTAPRSGEIGASPVISVKMRTEEIPQAPKPRPRYEIFVSGPRTEGVHFRLGDVARGGLRWSDRQEDFRTEVLGLTKAQGVKNAVIVPVGAKGGFVVRQAPAPTGDPAADRNALREEGIACYRQFIAGLLDITDNIDLQTGRIIPPPQVVRRDGDDPYLVVAADKGTAAFSDIANEVAAGYGFWLGDAFASGGSAGYDHKGMGITARGAWESVKRHFRELGLDTQSEDFTAVGIGDMSGDVFGNGMLCSPHIRLVAAFDHRDIFIDPNPDAARSYPERKRLFELPGSSWADYDTDLISAGGGVWSRSLKSVPIGPEIRAALGLAEDVEELSPPELIKAILTAPVDLLWNGGIGTYIKSSEESHAEVGDKANDPIRVDGCEVRARVVGEGGNLGVTERGRIEVDLSGGRINTDAMDNSAGVDCSDHEVNIKILLNSAVSENVLPAAERNDLLAAMTDDVADLVLADNILQNTELGYARSRESDNISVHTRLLARLAERGVDLELEALPTPEQLRARRAGRFGRGLTSPELATLMAHVKLDAKTELLQSDLPDNEFFDPWLFDYFPQRLAQAYPEQIRGHRLRREIVATTVINDIVGHLGITYLFRLTEGTGATLTEAIRATIVSSRVFGLPELLPAIMNADAPVEAIDEMLAYARRLQFRAARWFLAYRPQPLALAAEVTRYADRIAELSPQLLGWLAGESAEVVGRRIEKYRDSGVPTALAEEVAVSLHRFCLLDIIDAAEIADRNPAEVGELYLAAMDYFGLEPLLTAVSELPRGDRWHALARLALRDDMLGAHRALVLKLLERGEPQESAAEKIADWVAAAGSRLDRVQAVLTEITETAELDLATLSVAARQLRSVVR